MKILNVHSDTFYFTGYFEKMKLLICKDVKSLSNEIKIILGVVELYGSLYTCKRIRMGK